MKDRFPSKITLEGSEPQKGKWPAPGIEKLSDEDVFVFPGEGKILLED